METVIIKKILKYNFYLSKWFAGKKQDKIISGTSFLFLNQVCFLFLAFYLIILKFLPFALSPMLSACVVMLFILFLMYGFQKKVEESVRKNNYDKDFNALTIKTIFKYRLVPLLLFIFPFILCFIVAIFFYS